MLNNLLLEKTPIEQSLRSTDESGALLNCLSRQSQYALAISAAFSPCVVFLQLKVIITIRNRILYRIMLFKTHGLQIIHNASDYFILSFFKNLHAGMYNLSHPSYSSYSACHVWSSANGNHNTTLTNHSLLLIYYSLKTH